MLARYLWLALLEPALADWYTYPVKSINLTSAATPVFYNGYWPGNYAGFGELGEAHMVYGIATSDGGVVMCGKGAEGVEDTPGAAFVDAVVMKTDADGTVQWTWRSNVLNSNDVCSGMAQLPSGGDVLVAGYETLSNVATGFIAALNLSTGAPSWSSFASFPAASTGSHSALESVSVSSSDGVLVPGVYGISTNDEMAFHSYGNVPDGTAILYKFPIAAFEGSTPPTVADASWSTTFPTLTSVKAAYFMPDGKVAALITSETETSLAVLNGGTGLVEWGPIDFHSVHGEATDMKVSDDGTTIVMSGQGAASVGGLSGRLTGVNAATGSHLWTTTFSAGGTPTLIFNECWGVAPIADGGFAVSCGTGIEDCSGDRNTADCLAGNGDPRPGAYTRPQGVWQSLTARFDSGGTLLWQRVDSFKESTWPALGQPGWVVSSSAAEYIVTKSDGTIYIVMDDP